MQRVLVILLVPALIATIGGSSLLHTHAYGDHDHPEHHHGLSAHGHQLVARARDDGAAHLKDCDPGQHTVSYAFVSAAPLRAHAAHAELTVPAAHGPDIGVACNVRPTDIRVHGPPPLRYSSPRAPPLIALA